MEYCQKQEQGGVIEDAINRIDQLCEKLGFGSDINILAVNLFRAMYQAGVAKKVEEVSKHWK